MWLHSAHICTTITQSVTFITSVLSCPKSVHMNGPKSPPVSKSEGELGGVGWRVWVGGAEGDLTVTWPAVWCHDKAGKCIQQLSLL